MPDKPLWYARLDRIIAEIQALPDDWVDRESIQYILGVKQRRAQQIMQPLIRRMVGQNGLARRDEVIAHLRALAAGTASEDIHRRERLISILDAAHKQLKEQPRVLVEATPAVFHSRLNALPEGVSVKPGEISIRFGSQEEALEKMLALVLAIGNEPEAFEEAVNPVASAPQSHVPLVVLDQPESLPSLR